MERYTDDLAGADHCLTYLSERGIEVEPDLPAEYGNPWSLGYVGSAAMPEHEGKVGMLAIPYLVPFGPPIGVKFRALDNSVPKYKAHSGMGTHLFGVLNLQVDSDVIGVTEGELDTIVATDAGIPSVAVPGANSWREEWRYIFEGYSRVLIFGDGDDAGRTFANKLANDIPNGEPIHMPEGDDVTSLVVKTGADALRKRAGL